MIDVRLYGFTAKQGEEMARVCEALAMPEHEAGPYQRTAMDLARYANDDLLEALWALVMAGSDRGRRLRRYGFHYEGGDVLALVQPVVAGMALAYVGTLSGARDVAEAMGGVG